MSRLRFAGYAVLATVAIAWLLGFPLQADPLARTVLAWVEEGPFP